VLLLLEALGAGNAYLLPKALGCVDRMPGPCLVSRREERRVDKW
jgi:hypothetical protein